MFDFIGWLGLRFCGDVVRRSDLTIRGITISFLTPAILAFQRFFCALFVSISYHCIETEIILFNLVHRGKPDSMTAS